MTYGGSDRTESPAIGADGVVDLPAVRTRQLTLVFEAQTPRTSVDSLDGRASGTARRGVGGGGRRGPHRPLRRRRRGAAAVRLGSRGVGRRESTYETAVRASARQVVEASIVPATLCDRPVFLRTGISGPGVEASFSWIPLGARAVRRPTAPSGRVDEICERTRDIGVVFAVGTIGARPRTKVVDARPEREPSTLVLAVPAGKGWTAVRRRASAAERSPSTAGRRGGRCRTASGR